MVSKSHDIIGFIKFNNEIGIYRTDYESWVLDSRAYALAQRQDPKDVAKRRDGRFAGKLVCPGRKEDFKQLVEWFDAKATLNHNEVASRLEKLAYLPLDGQYEENLPVVLYDFDTLTAFENPDLNPYHPYDDYLPEGWKYVVVEGFDALVPDVYVYWAKYAARLDHRDENTL